MVKNQSISEKFTSSLKVKVTKNESDSRNSLCGGKMQVDDEGNEYFIIPAHQAEYQSKIHPHYTFGPEFVPDDASTGASKEEKQTVKPLRGNPNWRKNKADPMVKSSDFVTHKEEEEDPNVED